MWILSSLVEQVRCWGAVESWNGPLEPFPVHRPFTAEIYRQKAARLHKRS